jgi:hypothetical protein
MYEADYNRLDELPVMHTPLLYKKMKDKLQQLRQASYVCHGDFRDTNVMFGRSGDGKVLLDFDWAGEIGVVPFTGGLLVTRSRAFAETCLLAHSQLREGFLQDVED